MIPFIASGDGYAGDTTFEPFEILVAPCDDRESRIFYRTEMRGTRDNLQPRQEGCDYRSHWFALAKPKSGLHTDRDLYVLAKHGGGTRVLRVPTFFDNGEMKAALLAMPERALYALLHTMYDLAQDAADAARDATSRMYKEAFVQGRLKKSRPKQGQVRVTIEPAPPCPESHELLGTITRCEKMGPHNKHRATNRSASVEWMSAQGAA